ncbi:MAG TPA: hypothetical protein VIF43_01055 [Patescibacteria group bacterium]|jgi:hypothetical protein
MEREHSEEERQNKFRKALASAIEIDDQEFATQLLEGRDVDPSKMVGWLERQAQAAEPEVAIHWYRTIQSYAQRHINERHMYGDTTVLEAARDRALWKAF